MSGRRFIRAKRSKITGTATHVNSKKIAPILQLLINQFSVGFDARQIYKRKRRKLLSMTSAYIGVGRRAGYAGRIVALRNRKTTYGVLPENETHGVQQPLFIVFFGVESDPMDALQWINPLDLCSVGFTGKREDNGRQRDRDASAAAQVGCDRSTARQAILHPDIQLLWQKKGRLIAALRIVSQTDMVRSPCSG